MIPIDREDTLRTLFQDYTKANTDKERNRIEREIEGLLRVMYPPKFEGYTYDDYIKDLKADEIRFIENMSAKEPLDKETALHQEGVYCEEKLDGVRADVHFTPKGIRLFSRRISSKTNWYSENTDSFPHIRDYKFDNSLYGTVIDGEFTFCNSFKEVSSLFNCKYDKAIFRQILHSKEHIVTFHAFDILYYKGANVMSLPLHKRKELLLDVLRNNIELEKIGLRLHPYYKDNEVYVYISEDIMYKVSDNPLMYPYLNECIEGLTPIEEGYYIDLTFAEYFDYVVASGGEGIMLKDINGKYEMKRTRAYEKIKKYDTWDVILMAFTEPTKVYEGKEIDTWKYWEGDTAVTKDYYFKRIGNIKFGVIVTKDELQEWKERNPKETYNTICHKGKIILEVGETSGITEEMKDYFTENMNDCILRVIEVGANDQIKKTGRLRHPRFIRLRNDKNWEDCRWKDHLH